MGFLVLLTHGNLASWWTAPGIVDLRAFTSEGTVHTPGSMNHIIPAVKLFCTHRLQDGWCAPAFVGRVLSFCCHGYRHSRSYPWDQPQSQTYRGFPWQSHPMGDPLCHCVKEQICVGPAEKWQGCLYLVLWTLPMYIIFLNAFALLSCAVINHSDEYRIWFKVNNQAHGQWDEMARRCLCYFPVQNGWLCMKIHLL